MQYSSRLAIPSPEDADVPDFPAHLSSRAAVLDKAAITDHGPLSNRPVSTAGSPGIKGRRYYAEDVTAEYLDTGTGWVRLQTGTAVKADAIAPLSNSFNLRVSGGSTAAGAATAGRTELWDRISVSGNHSFGVFPDPGAGGIYANGQIQAAGAIYAMRGAATEVIIGDIGPANQAGIRIGGTGLYKLGTNQLKTDGQFFTGGPIAAHDGDSARYVQIGGTDITIPAIRLGLGAALLYASSGVENLRIIRGTVNADGSIARGSGFTVTKGAAGIYTINFGTAFPAEPSVTVNYADNASGFEQSVSPSAASCSITTTGTGSAAAADRRFSFIASGPR